MSNISGVRDTLKYEYRKHIEEDINQIICNQKPMDDDLTHNLRNAKNREKSQRKTLRNTKYKTSDDLHNKGHILAMNQSHAPAANSLNQSQDELALRRINCNSEIFDNKSPRENREILAQNNGERRQRKQSEKRRKKGSGKGKNKNVAKDSQNQNVIKRTGPAKKDNHDDLFYDQNKMPLQKLFQSFGKWKLPADFKASKIKIKISGDEAAPWTNEHDFKIEHGTDLGKTVGHLKFENISEFKLLGMITMYDEYIKPGEDFTLLSKKEKVYGYDKDMIYVGIKNFKTALILAYAIGGAAVAGNFLGSLSRCSNFRMQFSNPDGDYKKLMIRWETKEWYDNLIDVLKEWIRTQKKTTHGVLRFDLLAKRSENDKKCLKKNELPVNIQQHNIPMHPDNFLHPLSTRMEKLKPGTYVLQCWKTSTEKREFNLVNDWGSLIKFFRPFKKEIAEKELKFLDKKHEIEVDQMRQGGMDEKQIGRFKSSRRKKTQAKLRQISINNGFLKMSDRESNLHRGYAYLFTDVKTFGTLEDDDLFKHLMEKEKERCPTVFLNEFDDKNPDEAAFKQLWANCGGEVDNREWLMRLLHHMKKNWDKQIKAINFEVGSVSSFAAETRNIMEHKTTENSLKADLALHYISEMMKEGSGEGIDGFGEKKDINDVKQMLEDRQKMSQDRDGGVPTVFTGKDILDGKTSLIAKDKTVKELINFFNSGKYYNVESSGFSSKEEERRGLKRNRTTNSAASNAEKQLMDKESKRAKTKECDFVKPSNPNGGYKEGQTCDQLKHFSELVMNNDNEDFDKTEEMRDDLEDDEADEPSTMTALAINMNTLGNETQNISVEDSALMNENGITVEISKKNEMRNDGAVSTPMKKEKTDRTINRVVAMKNKLLKEDQKDDLLNISDSEISDYNFKAANIPAQENKAFKFRHGINITTMKKYKWPSRGHKPKETNMFLVKIYLKVMRDTWHCMVIRYIQHIISLIKVFKKIHENKLEKGNEGINEHFYSECIAMIEDLDNVRRILDLETTTQKLINMDRCGIEIIPIPSIAMYEAINRFLPLIASNSDMTLNLTPVTDISRLLERTQTLRASIDSTKITNKDSSINIEKPRTGKEFIANDRNLFFDEFEERIDRSELLIQTDCSDHTYSSFENEDLTEDLTVNELLSPVPCKMKSKPQSTPKRSSVKTKEPERKMKTSIKVSKSEGKTMIGDKELKNEFLGLKLKKKVVFETNDSKEQSSKCIKMPYIPRSSNAPVKWEYSDELFTNFAPTTNSEINVAINNFEFKTKIREKPYKAMRSFPLSVLYTNINPPVHIKLKNLVNEFPQSCFVCTTELMQKGDDINDRSIIPIGYTPYCHKMIGSGIVLAMILVKNCIEGKIEVLFDEPPFVLLSYRKNKTLIAIGTFYRPHDNSVLYEREFSKEVFNHRFNKFINACKKIPSIITADCNIDFDHIKGSEQRSLKNIMELKLASHTKLETGPTFWKNEETNTTIDHVWFKRMVTPKISLFNGRTMIGNDGHAIMKIETDITMNGIIGETKIVSRPKLDAKTVETLGRWVYDDLHKKLKAEEEKLLTSLNEGTFEGDDNGYCELAFNFFEDFFKELQPEEKKTIKIYNNRTVYSADIAKLNIIAACLCYDIKNTVDDLQKDKLQNALKSIIRLRDRGRRTEERLGIIGRLNANDDDIHTICKSLRPKLRGLEITKEIFTADQLIDEFVRVYENVVKHVDESKVVVNILDMCPKFDEAMKFSFKNWLPTWEHSLTAVKTIEQCFNQLKPITRGLNSSVYRDGIAMMPIEYCEILNNMILYWIKAGNYPEKFLSGKLRAILKKGDPSEIQNRRFISVGNFFQQLLGKVVASCLLAFCEKNGLLDKDQFGFRTKRSCDQAVAQLMNKVGSRHSTTVTAIIMLDLSSAFFCVKKDLLIDVLSTFVNNDALRFFKQMLRPIKARVVSDGVESDEKEVPNYGVRQGDGCSPLFFNITINKMFEYVRREMTSRYDREMVQIQGFADDSILIITAKTVEKLKSLIEEALKKTNEYVTSVGFKINAKKSEVMIVSLDKKKRECFGDVLHTEMGDMEIKQSLNVLGLRFDTKLSFKPQFNHLMSKIGRLRKDVIELIGMGTNAQILSNAFAKSNGIYLYGIGIQRKWTQRQYKRAQKEVNDLIRMVYNIKWKRENSWSQRDLLRLANWPPIRIQHEMAAMLFLNKIAMMPNVEYLHQTLSHHLRFPNGRKVLEMNFKTREENYLNDVLCEDWIPTLGANNDDRKYMGKKGYDVFPLSSREWFNKLPNFIRYRIGTKSFEEATYGWYHVQCWCRNSKECSKCKKRNVIRMMEHEDFNELLKEIIQEEQSTLEEWTRRSHNDLNSFELAMSVENEIGDTFNTLEDLL